LFLDNYSVAVLALIGLSVFMIGMSKGGFPAGAIALPLLILAWPEQARAARSAVAFLLPLLCAMDIVAMIFYRRHVLWKRLLPLLPGTLAGVAVGSVLFVSDDAAMISVSDRALKLCIGAIGLLFVAYRAAGKWILKRFQADASPGKLKATVFGFGAGITSTLAHAGGPVMQMYFLPQRLQKLDFAGTLVAFFFVLNLVKLLPFGLLGRIETGNLLLGACMLPLIPVGVGTGYLLVRLMKQRHYIGFIYSCLFFTSLLLIVRAVREM